MTTTGVVLMTYGSPRDPDDVGAYMTRVRGGRQPSPELLVEFRRRYDAIGMSPLVPITEHQAAALERALGGADAGFRVAAGMRFSAPSVEAAARQLVDRGADRLLGLILSPQYSPLLMAGYATALDAAAGQVGVPSRTVGTWHLEPSVVRALAARIQVALREYPADVRDEVPVLMTAHSLPRRVVDREPGYVDQLHESADAIAAAAGLAPERWLFAYQSAGHTPEEWLKPDMLDVLPELAARGHRAVLLAPVQFLADHLETLYDIDIAGREQAIQAGISRFARVPAPNDSPDFAAALADVVRRDLARWDGRPEAAPRAPVLAD
ncbi:MAG: ferrochelatase [Chloroflexi bacterium]|nr:ferrochelatase [Chloroflexota bacterium]